jgi:hypothetical protein
MPPSTNSDGAPITVSDPNQVANIAEPATTSGNFLPATTKSAVLFTLREAQNPTSKVASRYIAIKNNNMCRLNFFWPPSSKWRPLPDGK